MSMHREERFIITSAAGIYPSQETSHKVIGIADIFPTQVTVGLREVDIKRKRWRERNSEEAAEFLRTHPIPVVLGPGDRLFVVDRHHLARALEDEGVSQVFVSVLATMAELKVDEFWRTLEIKGWTHPFDDNGERRPYENIPKSICTLIDDPYRSLAGALKRAGAYVKDKTFFSEFHWADYLRKRIERRMVESDFDSAFAFALALARSRDAAALPGWRPAQL